MAEPHANRAIGLQHLWVSCPNCKRDNLRIRRANVGRKVRCKHCGEVFRAKAARDPGAIAPDSVLPIEPLFAQAAEADSRRLALLESALTESPSQLAAQAAGSGAALQELEQMQEILELLRRRCQDLEEQLAQAHEQLRRSHAERHELEQVRSQNDRLRAAVEQLRREVAEGARSAREHTAAGERELEQALLDLVTSPPESGADFGDIHQLPGLLVRPPVEQAEEPAPAPEGQRIDSAPRDELEQARSQNEGLRATLEELHSQTSDGIRRQEALRAELQETKAQLASLIDERDRAVAARAEESQTHRSTVQVLKSEVELAQRNATASGDRAATAEAARAEVERCLSLARDQHTAANVNIQRLELAAQAARDRLEELQNNAGQESARAGVELEAARSGTSQLKLELEAVRGANERLRSLLSVFGMVDHLGQ
jgi:chromosome segregation ATPase